MTLSQGLLPPLEIGAVELASIIHESSFLHGYLKFLLICSISMEYSNSSRHEPVMHIGAIL